ncbi:hypothetical protein AURDEDRAFT_149420 [Auricularia subglabra TFB-10046 SS5]|nr:hypothetical protein AURDEDRAFT_149420 [Auricularia subglabra TFB-10046 SS5]
MDSPSTSSSTGSKPKSLSSDAALRPFPMKLLSKVSPKRPAEEGTDSDRATKRRKQVQEAPKSPVVRPTITKSPGSPDTPKQPAVDPSRLCPYCDELLPDTRSPEFEELLRGARAKSWPKPRRANPLGLKAPMTVFVSVCERHRFEAKVLPQAIRAGWPTTIDFDSIPARVKRKRRILDDILKDPSTSSFFREAMDNVARVGARVAESAMGQYAIFERIQPGYYGERGAVVLHQTLFSLYTPEDLQKSHHLFAPLSTQTFQHSVLVPEAALALIMDDRGETRAQALKTMRASSRYGNLMFPDDDEADGVGEAMMRERARQRRIEIEKEEREEMEAERAAAEAAKKAKAKKSKGKVIDTESQTDASTSRKKTTKSKAKTVDDGMESCDSTATRRSARNTRRAAMDDESGTDASTTSNRPARTAKTRATSYVEVSDSDDEPVLVTAEKAKKRATRAAPADCGGEPIKVKKRRAPTVDSDDEPVLLSVPKAKKRSASPRASSRAPKKAATSSRLSPTATATDSESTALSDLSQHSRARRARKGSPVIDLTSEAEELPDPSSSVSRLSRSNKPVSSSSRVSTRSKYSFMDSESEDEAIPDVVMQGLQHQSPPLTQRASSPQRRKAPSRAGSVTRQHSRSRPVPSDEDLQATPVARRQHTRWDDHGKASEATEEVTPRPIAMHRTSSYGSHRSSGTSKGIFQPRSADSWLLSGTSSPSQKAAQASPSRESNYEEDAEDFFNMTMELSD